MKSNTFNNNLFKIFKKYGSSYIWFTNNKQNLKKFCNLKNIDLKKNSHTNKIEIFIDDKILLTNSKNVFSLENFDLCFLIKLELLKNKNEMDILKMPLTLSSNNLIDFINSKKGNQTLEKYDYKDKNFLKDITNNVNYLKNFKSDKVNYNNGNGIGINEKNKIEDYNIKKNSSFSKNTYYEDNIYKNNFCQNNLTDIHCSNNDKNTYMFNYFETERTLIENKIYENFKNDLIFYSNNEKNMLNTDKKCLENSISLPSSLNYIENYKINNLYKEESDTFDMFIKMFEKMHEVKLNKAKNFETPIQNQNAQEKVQTLIKNMNDSEIFIFYKCTQILNSFIFTYLFLNNHLNYKEVYRYCNLEYIYQFFKWGYVFDVNIIKDSNALLMLSSLRLINKILKKKKV
ncbi:conserved Plasmodium protein, unknown function [Plasmodium relictum]|uniref:ATP synthase mitochondrial F1 complex assembly factor 2 n=1 Tax=Plasmodium relictum TaxID=85471 RepID=A0A1J1H687_PLARL|nr:conserved Plasmodium protein, unknown function [Plasmodium relictum]CRG99114.1 conserved Plasmodium protein, unknown function [Plasmodium relictum]